MEAPPYTFEASLGLVSRICGGQKKKQPAMCLSSKKYTGKVNACEMKNGTESRTHFEWAWTETIPPCYATTGITGI